MAKKSAADLKAEGAELSTLIASVRKRPHNFALLIGKDGLVLEAHPKKSPDIMRRQAKANGGGPKGAVGQMSLSGKVLTLTCQDDSAPKTLPKLAKKHFSERGLAYKVLLETPSGVVSDDDEEDAKVAEGRPRSKAFEDLEEIAKRGGDDAPDEAPAPKVDEAPAEPEGDAAPVDAAPEEAPTGPPAEDTPTDAAPPEEPTDPDTIRAQLTQMFQDLKGPIGLALQSSNKGAAKKVSTLVDQVAKTLPGTDMKRAAQLLKMLSKTVKDVNTKFPPVQAGDVSGPLGLPDAAKAFFGDLFEAASEIVEDVVEDVVEGVVETAGDIKDAAVDTVQTVQLRSMGLSAETTAALVEQDDASPGTVNKIIEDMNKGKIPPGDMERLIKLKATNPKTYDAAVAAMEALDPAGDIDVSPEAYTNKLKEINALREAAAVKQRELDALDVQWYAAQKALNDAAKDERAKLKITQDAVKARDTYLATLDPDPANRTPAETAQLTALQTALNTANTVLATAKVATNAAKATFDAKTAEFNAKLAERKTEQAKIGPAVEAMEKLEEKKALLDEMRFGVLSESAGLGLSDEQNATLIQSYATDPGVGEAAFKAVDDAIDPGKMVENVGFVLDKLGDGFADKDGNAITATDAQKKQMAANAIKMGAHEGQAYFDGLEAYLKSGKQNGPDASGALATPLNQGAEDDPAKNKLEAERKKRVDVKRSAMMAGSVLDSTGKVDFTSDKAKEQMDHLKFHPGSLLQPAPALVDQIQSLEGNFADATLGPKLNAVIDGTKMPTGPATSKKRKRADKLVGGTVVKTGALDDTDAKAAVMSAMMTPLSQASVGSCFTTASTRRIRETDPERAMQSYSDLIKDGTFTSADGTIVPVNTGAPDTENMLMRSWEYSVADAAANKHWNYESKKLISAINGGGRPNNLNGIKTIVGAAAWADTNTPAGGVVDGVESKIDKAILNKLKFKYDPQESASSSAGDGSSDLGVYNIEYEGNLILTKAAFVDAIEDIAFKATGFAPPTTEAADISKLVRDRAFIDGILSDYGDEVPWAVSGGFATETREILDGDDYERDELLPKVAPGTSMSVRSEALATSLITTFAGQTMPNVSTSGSNANHAFLMTPEHPSFQAIATGNVATNLENTLKKPGRDLAAKAMPQSECIAIFEAQVRKASAGWGSMQTTLLDAALAKKPDKDMSPAELNTHIKDTLEAARKAEEDRRVADWKATETAKGKAISAADEATRRTNVAEGLKEQVAHGTAAALADTMDLPEVVLCDTNWGDTTGHTYFVLAPDPSSGDLMFWKKDDVTGEMTPLGNNWLRASWSNVKKK